MQLNLFLSHTHTSQYLPEDTHQRKRKHTATANIHVLCNTPLRRWARFIWCSLHFTEPIFEKRYYLIAPMHTLCIEALRLSRFKRAWVCVPYYMRIMFLTVSGFLFLHNFMPVFALSLSHSFPFVAYRAKGRSNESIFYWPIDFHFCFAIYYNLILNLVHFTSISSIAHFFPHSLSLSLFISVVRLQFNFSENVNLFLQYHHHYMEYFGCVPTTLSTVCTSARPFLYIHIVL